GSRRRLPFVRRRARGRRHRPFPGSPSLDAAVRAQCRRLAQRMTGPARAERIMTALPSLTLAVLLACPLGAAAQEAFVPAAAFLQAGASQGTQSFTAGLAWDLPYAWT